MISLKKNRKQYKINLLQMKKNQTDSNKHQKQVMRNKPISNIQIYQYCLMPSISSMP